MADDLLDPVIDETTPPEGVVDTPVESTSDEPAPETAEAARAERVDRGDGRDNQGKFVGRSGEGETEAAAGADAAEAVGDTTQPVAEGAPPAAEAVVEDEPPFAFKAVGQDLFVPGSKVTKDGAIIIPKESRELVESFLGKGVKLEHEREAIKRERFEMRIEQEKAKVFVAEVNRLMEIADIQDDQQFAEAMLAYGLELRMNKPTLQREVALAEREARLQVQHAMTQPDPGEQRELIDRQIEANIVETIGQLRSLPEFNALADREWGELQRLMQTERERFYYRAGERLTPEEQAAGIQPGEIVLNGHRLMAEAQRMQAIKSEAKAEIERARKAAEEAKKVAEANARKLQAAKTVVTPAPRAAATPASASTNESAESRREAYMREMGLLR